MWSSLMDDVLPCAGPLNRDSEPVPALGQASRKGPLSWLMREPMDQA